MPDDTLMNGLHDLGAEVAGEAPTRGLSKLLVTLQEQRTWRRRRRARLAVAASLALAAVAGATRYSLRLSGGTIVSARGLVNLPAGAFRSGSGGHAQLRLADGSGVELDQNTSVSLARGPWSSTIHLATGRILIEAAHQRWGRHLYIDTGDTRVTVVGTILVVEHEAAGSRVGVIEGAVRVHTAANNLRLAAGQQATSTPNLPLADWRELTSWSDRAPALLAMLHLSAPAPVSQPHENRTASVPQASASLPPRFEVVSVKLAGAGPGPEMSGRARGSEWQTLNAPLRQMLAVAYGLTENQTSQIVGGPAWVDTAGFTISAKIPDGASSLEVLQMVQAMLADRFQLKLHTDTRQLPGMPLTIAPGGVKMTPNTDCPKDDPATRAASMISMARRAPAPGAVPPCGALYRDLAPDAMSFVGHGVAIRDLTHMGIWGGPIPVVDQTGLSGLFDFHLAWKRVDIRSVRGEEVDDVRLQNFDLEDKAVLEQLGLKIDMVRPTLVSLPVWVIDSASMPTPN